MTVTRDSHARQLAERVTRQTHRHTDIRLSVVHVIICTRACLASVGFAVDDDWPAHEPERDCSCLACIDLAEHAARRKLATMHTQCVVCGGLLTCWQTATHWTCRG